MSGFASAAAGKLIGPDGNPIDTEAFLADLTIYGVSANYNIQLVVVLTYSEL
jgi:hypothetical protein